MVNKRVVREMERLRLEEKDLARILRLPIAIIRKKLKEEMPGFEQDYFIAGMRAEEEWLQELSWRHRKWRKAGNR